MWPVLLSLSSPANQLCEEQASAEKQNGDVEEHFKALLVAQMEARNSNVPCERERGTGDQNQNAGDIFWPSLTNEV